MARNRFDLFMYISQLTYPWQKAGGIWVGYKVQSHGRYLSLAMFQFRTKKKKNPIQRLEFYLPLGKQ